VEVSGVFGCDEGVEAVLPPTELCVLAEPKLLGVDDDVPLLKLLFVL
jgi:hypothetical protein